MQGPYNPEAMGMESLKMEKFFRCKMAHKAARAFQCRRTLQRPILLSMEIRVHSRVCLARYKGCTNARAYNPEAMGMESFQMETISRCKRRTMLHGPSNVAVHCSDL